MVCYIILAFQMGRISASSFFVRFSDLGHWRQPLHCILYNDSFFIGDHYFIFIL